jgi:ArsR family transcriptional regulator
MASDVASEEPADAHDGTCGTEAALSASLPTAAVTDATVRLLKGFADQTRLRILCLLRDREVCVHDIVEALDMSQSAISHQLRVLRDARLVSHRREGAPTRGTARLLPPRRRPRPRDAGKCPVARGRTGLAVSGCFQ